MLHITSIGAIILIYVFSPQVELVSLPSNEAQFVELYDITELPAFSPQEIEQQTQELHKQDILAFQNVSAMSEQATPTPALTPTPTLEILPTPTATPKRNPTPTPKPRRAAPLRRTPVRSKTPVVTLGVPRRKPVIQRTPAPKDVKFPSGRPSQAQQPEAGTGQQIRPVSGGLSSRPSVTLDQTDEFPYPEYLKYIEEKIAGLWFPQGSGTVSIYLIIARNGKILKSGVDKGEGLGVNKLRDSVARAIAMVKRFDPLPQDYKRMALRVQITVRR